MLMLRVQSIQAALMEILSIQHDALMRVYDLFIPDNAGPAPLFVDTHGFTVTKSNKRGYSGFEALAAEKKGFSAAWSDGVTFSALIRSPGGSKITALTTA